MTKTTTDNILRIMDGSVALVRPLSSVGLFIYGLVFPEKLAALYDINEALGALVSAAVFGSAPAWGVSRHVQKREESRKD